MKTNLFVKLENLWNSFIWGDFIWGFRMFRRSLDIYKTIIFREYKPTSNFLINYFFNGLCLLKIQYPVWWHTKAYFRSNPNSTLTEYLELKKYCENLPDNELENDYF